MTRSTDLRLLELARLLEDERRSAGADASRHLVHLARRLEDEKRRSRFIVREIQDARAARPSYSLLVRR